MSISFLLAMGAPAEGANPIVAFLPMMAILAIIYFIVLRPMKKRQDKIQAFIEALKVGDRVITSGGVHGSITRVEKDTLQLQIADKVRIQVSRNAIVGYQGEEPLAPVDGTQGQT